MIRRQIKLNLIKANRRSKKIEISVRLSPALLNSTFSYHFFAAFRAALSQIIFPTTAQVGSGVLVATKSARYGWLSVGSALLGVTR